ncbi:stretch-activated cation channel Mid1, partial [Protomyces lactucae-debilis]
RFLFLQDADFSAALLTTGNLTSNALPNYQIWVNPSRGAVANNIDASIQESLQASYCGITRAKAQVTLANADRSMTTRGGNQPKEQFYVHDLQPSTFYDAYITLRNNLTEGGTIWPVQQFRTRDDTTCQIIYNLAFCNEIAYSVPSNSTLYNPVALGTYYDNRALAYFQNFSNTMQQYACNVSDDAKYSLVSTCDDCKAAYKDWLCAVTIPRCADTTNPASFLTLRNQSRSPLLDRDLHPGVYKEVLPCGDLPRNVARTCPAFIQFWLPSNKTVFDATYGQRSNNATISCNAPGVDFWVAGASMQRVN